jgi:hypothetical protein
MAGKQVHLVAWPVRMVRDGLWVLRNRAPEVGDESIGVVDRGDALAIGCAQQHRGASGEGFDVVVHSPKGCPDLFAGVGFAAEIWERGGKGAGNGNHF